LPPRGKEGNCNEESLKYLKKRTGKVDTQLNIKEITGVLSYVCVCMCVHVHISVHVCSPKYMCDYEICVH
jgi:hypothetical protein